MDYNGLAIISFIVLKFSLAILLAVGGIISIFKGSALYRDGTGLRRENTEVKIGQTISITTSSLGAVLMITSCGWGWFASTTIPTYKKNGDVIVLADNNDVFAVDKQYKTADPAKNSNNNNEHKNITYNDSGTLVRFEVIKSNDIGSEYIAKINLPDSKTAKITNINNGKSVIVRIIDRPESHGIDLTEAAASAIGLKVGGYDKVLVQPEAAHRFNADRPHGG